MVIASYFQKVLQKKMVCVCETERSNVLIYLGEMLEVFTLSTFLKWKLLKIKTWEKYYYGKLTLGGERAHINQ